MKIAQIVASLDPRYGGPSVSVPSLSGALARLGNQVNLLSTGSAPVSSETLDHLHLETFSGGWASRMSASPGLRRRMSELEADVFHSHGLWLRPLHYAAQASRKKRAPHVISPRGMMSGWAWAHRSWRKQFVRAFVHPGAFESATGWHATSEEEANDIRARGFRQPVCVAPNGVTAPSAGDSAAAEAYWQKTCPEVVQRPTALFYSRFHRKKRVLELIDLWLERAPVDWLLLMVGLDDEYTTAQLRAYVLRASGRDRVKIFNGHGVPPPYSVGSIFILPSRSENFGMAIAEAMAHGLPVLVTDTTPWSAIDARGAGWCVSWDSFASTLGAALAEGTSALIARGAVAREHVLAHFSWENSARILNKFYEELVSDRRKHP